MWAGRFPRTIRIETGTSANEDGPWKQVQQCVKGIPSQAAPKAACTIQNPCAARYYRVFFVDNNKDTCMAQGCKEIA